MLARNLLWGPVICCALAEVHFLFSLCISWLDFVCFSVLGHLSLPSQNPRGTVLLALILLSLGVGLNVLSPLVQGLKPQASGPSGFQDKVSVYLRSSWNSL